MLICNPCMNPFMQAAFLEPLKTRLGLEVALELFARSDAEFMPMFTGMC